MTTIDWNGPGWYARHKKTDTYILIHQHSYAWSYVCRIMSKRKRTLENVHFINYESEWEYSVGIKDCYNKKD